MVTHHDSGVVQQDIHCHPVAQRPLQRRGESGHRGQVGQVERQRHKLRARARYPQFRPQRLDSRLGLGSGPSRHDHERSGSGEAQRALKTQAGVGAGDDHRLACHRAGRRQEEWSARLEQLDASGTDGGCSTARQKVTP